MGVTHTSQRTVVTNDSERQTKKAQQRIFRRAPYPRVGGWGAEMAWIHSPFMRIDKRRSKNNNYHTYETWTCTVWCACTIAHKYGRMQTFLQTQCVKKTKRMSQRFEKSEMNSDCNFLKLSLKVSKGKQPRIKPWPTGREFKGLGSNSSEIPNSVNLAHRAKKTSKWVK